MVSERVWKTCVEGNMAQGKDNEWQIDDITSRQSGDICDCDGQQHHCKEMQQARRVVIGPPIGMLQRGGGARD
nr:hypothetical protein CFP56_03685 [Quercus suber]